MHETADVFTLIGDLVGSRRLPDRAAAQDRLGAVLGELTEVLDPVQALEATVGDEFQGAFASLADASLAALLVRLAMRPVVDIRCGLGFGPVTVHDATRRPLLQDGPGWWAAREALEVLDTHPRRRTWVVAPDADAVNAFLLCRDQLVERLNDRGGEILRLALLGRTQKQIAAELGITTSAVSQQVARGIGAVTEAHGMLGGGTSAGTRAGRRSRG